MKKIILIVGLIFCFSCKEYKNTLSTKSLDTDLPVEIIFYNKDFIDNDSIMIGLSIPQRLEIKNNFESDRVLKAITFDYKNLNKNDLGNKIFVLQNDKKKYLKYYKILKDYKEILDLYIVYKMLIPENLKKNIIEKGVVQNDYQNKYDYEIYSIGNIEVNRKFLNKTIPDSIKGFIKFHINKPEQTKSIFKYVPINF
ncbi:hypothetical protein ACSTS3_04635 [Aquimarina muelleri]|uniref:hypothetical protein n=1 Tax=Aquimarina muelleri TaxID=279356 RepID=UPI003F686927